LFQKADNFKWDNKCEEAFNAIKAAVSTTSVIEKPKSTSILLLYLLVSDDAISATLVQKERHQPIYFIGCALQGPETRYQVIEKVAPAPLYAARPLRPYFQSHPVIIKTDCPIGKVLQKPELVGRMITWSVELSEYDL